MQLIYSKGSIPCCAYKQTHMTHTHIHICTHTHMHTDTHVYANTHTCIHKCIHPSIHTHTDIYLAQISIVGFRGAI